MKQTAVPNLLKVTIAIETQSKLYTCHSDGADVTTAPCASVNSESVSYLNLVLFFYGNFT